MDSRIVVTGMGIVSACGSDQATVAASLAAGRVGIGPIRAFDTEGMRMRLAAEIPDFDPYRYFSPREVRRTDRATQLAVAAAGQALEQAGLSGGGRRIGVIVGASGANQFQGMPVPLNRSHLVNRWMALYQARCVPQFQTAVLAGRFGLGGIQATFSAASLGSALALGYGLDLLRSGKAPALLVGGAEIQTLLNALGMDVLDIIGDGPCAPFTGAPGMSFGEGAAFLVLERLDHAQDRGAAALGELLGYGVSADAYHPIANDPSGKGLHRAMVKALDKAGLDRGQIAWVRASGTGHREQDISESLALKTLFGDSGAIPPVTSSEPYFGHVNGVSPALGLVAALVAAQAGRVFPIPTAGPPRPGCDLPLLKASGPSPGNGPWLLNAVAFGGGNAALVADDYRPRQPGASAASTEPILVTGLGLVSPIGCGLEDFAAGLSQGRCGIGPIRRFPVTGCRVRCGALLEDFEPRRLVPRLDLRRRERLVQYALAAAALALDDAGLGPRRAPERIGLLVVQARGPVAAYQRFFATALQGVFTPATGKLMLKMGRFSVAGEIAHALDLKGYHATLAEGMTGGLHALLHGVQVLRQARDMDCLLVVAADEVCELSLRLFDAAGALAHAGRPGGERSLPYAPRAPGLVLGEGAAALLLERRSAAIARGARVQGRIAGYGLAATARPDRRPDAHGESLEAAIREALDEAGLTPANLDWVVGHGLGWPAHDRRETRTLERVLEGRRIPLSCVTGQLGVAEASLGLFGVGTALLGMARGEAFPLLDDPHTDDRLERVRGAARPGNYRRTLVVGSTEWGYDAALVLGAAAEMDTQPMRQ